MTLKTVVETYDGKLHEDACAARKYLEEQAGAQICQIARMITQTDGKYTKAIALLENPETEKHFRMLIRIREDMPLIQEDEA